MPRRRISAAIAYVIAAFLCFGWAWNHPSDTQRKCLDTATYNKHIHWCDVDLAKRVSGTVIVGVVWPIWVAGSLAIVVTKWP